MGLVPEKTPLTFGAALDKGFRISFFSLSFTLWAKRFSLIECIVMKKIRHVKVSGICKCIRELLSFGGGMHSTECQSGSLLHFIWMRQCQGNVFFFFTCWLTGITCDLFLLVTNYHHDSLLPELVINVSVLTCCLLYPNSSETDSLCTWWLY